MRTSVGIAVGSLADGGGSQDPSALTEHAARLRGRRRIVNWSDACPWAGDRAVEVDPRELQLAGLDDRDRRLV